MVIKGKRVRNIDKYLVGIKDGGSFYIGCSNITIHQPTLLKAGFSHSLEVGERLLPAPLFGSISLFNAEGLYIPMKDKPMETAYRQVEWWFKDWGKHWHSKIADVPYKRYPRRFMPPSSIELQISLDGKSTKFVSSDKLVYEKANHEKIKNTFNLFLEVFGEFEILTESLLQLPLNG